MSNILSVKNKLKEATRHSIIFGLGSITQSALQLILIPILTSNLPSSQIGVYYLVQMASTFAGAVFYFGITSAFPRSYFDYSDEEGRISVFNTAIFLLLLGALTQTLIGYFGGEIVSKILTRDTRYYNAVFWSFLSSALGFINQFFFSYLRMLRKSLISVILSLFSLVLSVFFSILLLKKNMQDLSSPFKGLAISQILILFVFLFSFKKYVIKIRINTKEVYILLKFGLPIVISSLAVLLMDWADRVIIERSLSLSQVGVYSISYKISSLINIVFIIPFSQIFSPMIIEYRSHSNIKDFFSKIFTYYFLVSCLIIITSTIFLPTILQLFVKNYYSSEVLFIIIAIMLGYACYGSVNILSAGFIFERKVQIGTIIYIIFALIKLVINLYIIPRFGILGASLTTVMIYTILPIVIYSKSKRYFSFDVEKKRLVILLLICFVSSLSSFILESMRVSSLLARLLLYLISFLLIWLFVIDNNEKSIITKKFIRLFGGR